MSLFDNDLPIPVALDDHLEDIENMSKFLANYLAENPDLPSFIVTVAKELVTLRVAINYLLEENGKR